jgi:hypothetical protein
MVGVPPSTTSNAISPVGKGKTDPVASVPDFGQTPLPIPDSVASAGKSLKVLRGLTESEIFKLRGQLREQVPGPIPSATFGLPEVGSSSTSLQTSSFANIGNTIRLDTTPPSGFQPRLVLHQEAISGFPFAGNTGNYAISSLPGNEGVNCHQPSSGGPSGSSFTLL